MAFFQTEHLWVNEASDGIAVIMLDFAGKDARLDVPWLIDLENALDAIEANSSFRSVVLCTAKIGAFCSGLKESVWTERKTPEEFRELAEVGQNACQRLADFKLPTVAWIYGMCVNGGLELALACDVRVVESNAELGMFDFLFGRMPCWGATFRLPHLIGLKRAAAMLIGGRRLSASEALSWGLADILDEEGTFAPTRHLDRYRKRDWNRWPFRGWRSWLFESNHLGRRLLLRGLERIYHRAHQISCIPAIRDEILLALRVGAQAGRDPGLTAEREGFVRVVQLPAFRNNLHVVDLLSRSAWKSAGRRPVAKVAVIAGSELANSLILNALLHELHVTVFHHDEELLGTTVFQTLQHLEAEVQAERLDRQTLKRIAGRIVATSNWKGFRNLDVVLDASGANPGDTRTLFEELVREVQPDTVLLSTAPWCTVETLQSGLQNPERVAAFVPWSTVNMSFVEVASGPMTRPEAVTTARDLASLLGRHSLVVPDRVGFVGFRILLPVWNEALMLVRRGLSPRFVDRTMLRTAWRFDLLLQADALGFEHVFKLAASMNFPLDPGWQRMREHDWHGLDSLRGFYVQASGKSTENRFIANACHDIPGPKMPALSEADRESYVRERLMGAMINEAFRCLDDGGVDADTIALAVMTAGGQTLFGGPIQYARDLGLANVVASLRRLVQEEGPRFEPCPRLVREAEANP